MMAPFADTINHHNVDSGYDIIKAEWRLLTLDQRSKLFPETEVKDKPAKS